jgi:hypothetical protein
VVFFFSAAYINFPYNLGVCLIALSLAAVYLNRCISWAECLFVGFFLSGVLLLIQAGIFPFYFKFAPLVRDFSFLADPFCWIMKLLGADSSATDNIIYIRGPKEVFPISITIEKLAVFEWVNLSFSSIIIVLLFKSSQRWKSIFFILISGILYLAIRFISVVLIYVNIGQMNVFWNSWFTLGSFAPLIALFINKIELDNKFLYSFSRITNQQKKSSLRSFLFIYCSLFIGIFCTVAYWGFNDPGLIKKGRIVIDERHSNWEWTTQKYDTKWFGMKSGYNYYSLFEYLKYYYKTDRNFEEIDSNLLKNCGVLIIKMPTSPFSDSEIKAIRLFVHQGGGLFLIGDHTNVFGTGTYINPIASQFGLTFKYDSTHDLRTGELSFYTPPSILPHPVVQNFKEFLFGSSCSLNVPWTVEEVMLGYGLKSMKADYSKKNFFNETNESPDMEFGQFYQAACVQYGKGRVLAFTDSTVFSNFWLHIPGKPELLLGSINWLNRKNSIPYNFKPVLLLFGFLLIISSFCLAYKNDLLHVNLNYICVALFAFVFASVLFSYLNRQNYSPLTPKTKFVKISFDLNHSSIFLPITELIGIPRDNYHTFYVWTQRLGYVPAATSDLEETLIGANLLLIINPDKNFSYKNKNLLFDYVEQGGKILLLDNALNVNSTANEICQLFGMELQSGKKCVPIFFDIKGRKISSTGTIVKIKGGKPILTTENNCPIYSIKKMGKGYFAIMSISTLFSNSYMGSTGMFPTADQTKLYELEFWMLKNLIER